jgi:hypothetical protein
MQQENDLWEVPHRQLQGRRPQLVRGDSDLGRQRAAIMHLIGEKAGARAARSHFIIFTSIFSASAAKTANAIQAG